MYHEALHSFLNLAESPVQLAGFWLRSAKCDYDRQCRPGIKHRLADGSSRMSTDSEETEPVDDEVPFFKFQWMEGAELLLDTAH